MNPLESELKNLLRRKDPPEGFAERVMARLETAVPRQTPARRVAAFLRLPTVRWAAVAAAFVAVVLGVARYQHEQRVRAQAERASQQAILALRITDEEINAALERAQHLTLRALEVPRNPKSEME